MRELRMRGTLSGFTVLTAVLLFCSCDRDDQQIKVYRVSKAPLESPPPPLDPGMQPNAQMPTNASSPTADAAPPSVAEKPQIKWDVPADWSSVPPSAMRYASFAAEKDGQKADIS